MVLTRKRAAGGSVSSTDNGTSESAQLTKTALATSVQDAGSEAAASSAAGPTCNTDNKTETKQSSPLPMEPLSKQLKASPELGMISNTDTNVSLNSSVTAPASSEGGEVACSRSSPSSAPPQMVIFSPGRSLVETPTGIPISGSISGCQFETVAVAPSSNVSVVGPSGQQQQQQQQKPKQVRIVYRPAFSGTVPAANAQQVGAGPAVSIGLASLFSSKAQTGSAGISTSGTSSVTLSPRSASVTATTNVPSAQSAYTLITSSPYTSVASSTAALRQVVVPRTLAGGMSLLAASSVVNMRPVSKSPSTAATFVVSPTRQQMTLTPRFSVSTTLSSSGSAGSYANLSTLVTRPSPSVINAVPVFPISASRLAVPATQTVVVPATQTVGVPSSAVHAPTLSAPPIQPGAVPASHLPVLVPASLPQVPGKSAAAVAAASVNVSLVTYTPPALMMSPSSSTAVAGSGFKTSRGASSSPSSSAVPREASSGASSAKLDESETSMTWDKESTLTLIRLYKEHKAYFEDHHYKKKSVWELIASKMQQGRKDAPKFRWNHVENKWKNMTKKYRDCVDMNRRNDTQTKCRFHDEIAAVYSYNHDDSHKVAAVEGHDQLSNGGLAGQSSVIVNGFPCSSCAVGTAVMMMPTKVERPSADEVISSSSDNGGGELQPVLLKKKKYARHDLSAATTVQHSVSSHKPALSHSTGQTHPSPPESSSDSGPDIASLLRQLREDRAERDQARMDRLEAMHSEKMKMFGQFLDFLKQSKQS